MTDEQAAQYERLTDDTARKLIEAHSFGEHAIANGRPDKSPPSAEDMRMLSSLLEKSRRASLSAIKHGRSGTVDRKTMSALRREARIESLREQISAAKRTRKETNRADPQVPRRLAAAEARSKAAARELRRLHVGLGGARTSESGQNADLNVPLGVAQSQPHAGRQSSDSLLESANAPDPNGIAFGRTRAEREAMVAKRPVRYRKGVVDTVWENHQNDEGKVYDPNSFQELTWDRTFNRDGQWEMGHVKGRSYDDFKKQFLNGEISWTQFLDEYNNPENYNPEGRSPNRSRRYQQRRAK
jgi:hypothetical protein